MERAYGFMENSKAFQTGNIGPDSVAPRQLAVWVSQCRPEILGRFCRIEQVPDIIYSSGENAAGDVVSSV